MAKTIAQVQEILSAVLPAGVSLTSKPNKFGRIDFIAESTVLADVQAARLAMLAAIRANGIGGFCINIRRRSGSKTKQYVWSVGEYERHGDTGYLVGETYRTGFDLRDVA